LYIHQIWNLGSIALYFSPASPVAHQHCHIGATRMEVLILRT